MAGVLPEKDGEGYSVELANKFLCSQKRVSVNFGLKQAIWHFLSLQTLEELQALAGITQL